MWVGFRWLTQGTFDVWTFLNVASLWVPRKWREFSYLRLQPFLRLFSEFVEFEICFTLLLLLGAFAKLRKATVV